MTAAEANLVKENVSENKTEKQATEEKPATAEEALPAKKQEADMAEPMEEGGDVKDAGKEAADKEEDNPEAMEASVDAKAVEAKKNGGDVEEKPKEPEKTENAVEGKVEDKKDAMKPEEGGQDASKDAKSDESKKVETKETPEAEKMDEDAPVTEAKDTTEGESEAKAQPDEKKEIAETVPEQNAVEDDKKEESKTEVKSDGVKSDEKGDDSKPEDKKDEAKPEDKKDVAVEATLHLTQGKRHMLVQDFVSAVESLQKACELLSAQYGDNASECGEALLFYGRALMELHRKQSSALNEVDAAESEDSSEEEGDGEEQEGEAAEGEKKEEGEKESGDAEEKKSESEDAPKDEEDLEKPEPALQDSKLDAVPEETAVDIGETTTNEDASSDLQIAFEVLDLAKSIFKRDAEKNSELYLKAAECLLSLGEVGLESDNYTQALEDFEECLRIQQEMLPKDSRVLAETHYQLGLTYSFVNKYDTSAAYFSDAMQILKLKVDNLKKFAEEEKKKGEDRGSLDDDPVWRAEREIEDIENLLPEIQSKLDDAREMQKEKADGPKEEIINKMLNRTPEASPVKNEGKVNVISSSLIKRKRPLEENEGPSHADKKLKE